MDDLEDQIAMSVLDAELFADMDPTATSAAILDSLEATPRGSWTEGPFDDVARRFALLTRVTAVVHELLGDLNDQLVASMEDDAMAVPGVGVLAREKVVRSSWKDKTASADLRENLIQNAARTVAADIGTGDVDEVKRNIATAALTLAFSAVPSFDKLTQAGAKALGMRISDYRDYSDAYKVKITDPLEP
jgi:hypothetical protein